MQLGTVHSLHDGCPTVPTTSSSSSSARLPTIPVLSAYLDLIIAFLDLINNKRELNISFFETFVFRASGI